MRWQSIVKFIIGLIIISGVGWLIYLFGQRFLTREPLPPIERPNGAAGLTIQDLPQTPKLSALIKNPAVAYWINSVTGAVYYLNPAGQVIRKTDTGEETVNSQTLDKLNSVVASPDGTFAIAKFNYPNQPIFSIFNTVTSGWQPLPENTVAVAWASNSQQLAYLENKNSSGGLKILNVVSQKTQEILKFSQAEAQLYWVKPFVIYLSNSAASADYPASLWSIDLRKKTLQPLIREENGLVFNWSANGDLGLKLNNSQGQPKLSLIDDQGSVLKEFTFVTLPEKCVFESRKLYCAVPQFLRDNLFLPDDYYKKAVYFRDDIYLIDIDTATATLLLSGDENLIDAQQLTIRNGELFFLNRYDNLIYRLRL
jgi:hypothetical protein